MQPIKREVCVNIFISSVDADQQLYQKLKEHLNGVWDTKCVPSTHLQATKAGQKSLGIRLFCLLKPIEEAFSLSLTNKRRCVPGTHLKEDRKMITAFNYSTITYWHPSGVDGCHTDSCFSTFDQHDREATAVIPMKYPFPSMMTNICL